jgi:hypothetical protein
VNVRCESTRRALDEMRAARAPGHRCTRRVDSLQVAARRD